MESALRLPHGGGYPAWMRASLLGTAASALLGLAACGAEPEPGALPAYHLERAGLDAELTERGAAVASSRGAPWAFHAAPRRFGCDGALSEVGAAWPAAAKGRVEYRRPGLVEWYAGTPAGIEQGFTLPSPPCSGDGRGVVVELGSGLHAVVSPGGRGARLRDASGWDVLRYTGLAASDAAGRALPAVLEARDEGLAVRVDDEGAVYPIEIDPLIWAPAAMLTPHGKADGSFGEAAAVSGDTIVVGAPGGGSSSGAAFVFVRSGTTWTQQKELRPSGGATQSFGQAVASSGDTALIGAANGAYVFDRTGTAWTQTQMLVPPKFIGGMAVALDGDTAVIGSGVAAYVYVRTGLSWSLQQELTGGPDAIDYGSAVALSGDTIVVGAPGNPGSTPGTAYVYVRSGTTWSEQATISMDPLMDNFALAVAVVGDTAVVGAPLYAHGTGLGSAFVFSRTGTTWTQTQELDDDTVENELGAGVAFDGTTVVLTTGAPETGADGAHVYALDGGTFGLQQVLPAGDEAGGNFRQDVVAVDGTTLVTGSQAIDEVVVFELAATDGSACASATDCASGFCVDGVCCVSASCPPAGPCNAAEHCQPGTGTCSSTPIHEGMACDADDACMHDAVCQHGACVGPTESCAPANECQEFGTCDSATGVCANPPKPDGTPCTGGVCKSGACDTGSAPPSGHGCGCGVAGAPGDGLTGIGVGVLILARRRRRPPRVSLPARPGRR